ncbi:MAG: hypothetical protein ACLFQX_02015 [Candidatus Kapaibacterium sp.]
MTLEYINFLLALSTSIITSLGVFFAVRSQIRRNMIRILDSRIEDERRHASHETGILLINQKLDAMEKNINSEFSDVKEKFSGLFALIHKTRRAG